MFNSKLLNTLSSRGYLYQCTNQNGLDELATKEVVVAYTGYDCTARSLHVGNLLSVMMLRALQRCGHKPIIIMGGGTTKIGDPSGKDEQRRMITEEEINSNMASMSKVFAKFIALGTGPTDAVIINNATWLESINYIEFLRDVGRHFSINRMLGFDSVKLRLEREQPLSFLEFNYMLLQAYDFVELFKRNNCRLQFGGSDQWGNIVNGVELGRKLGTEELFGLTCELLTTKSGKKMGKSVNGAIWLDADLLSPYDYWQFWRNTEDGDVERFLKLYTELEISQIEEMMRTQDINDCKVALANEATGILHGMDAATKAHQMALSLFNNDVAGVEAIECDELFSLPLYQLLVITGLCKSNSEARRLITGRGARINGEIVDQDRKIVQADLRDGVVKISAGQKKHVVLKDRGQE